MCCPKHGNASRSAVGRCRPRWFARRVVVAHYDHLPTITPFTIDVSVRSPSTKVPVHRQLRCHKMAPLGHRTEELTDAILSAGPCTAYSTTATSCVPPAALELGLLTMSLSVAEQALHLPLSSFSAGFLHVPRGPVSSPQPQRSRCICVASRIIFAGRKEPSAPARMLPSERRSTEQG